MKSEAKYDTYFGQRVKYSFENADEKITLQNEEKLTVGAHLCSLKANEEIVIGALLEEGGEGRIYESSKDGYVLKIYNENQRTVLKEKKLLKMLEIKNESPSICWPLDIVTFNGKFVGFLMERAEGKSLLSLVSNPTRINKRYLGFDRRRQVEILIKIIKAFKNLHSKGILVGDVSLKNIRFDPKTFAIKLVDVDSVQIGEFPCAVTTDGYDSPEVIRLSQGNSVLSFYNENYRTMEMENYALSVLIYRFLMNGYKPYDYRDYGRYGYDNDDNELCLALAFPYGESAYKTRYSAQEKTIWSHLPSFLKTAFVNTFKKGVRYEDEDWLRLFKRYKELIEKGNLKADNENLSFYPLKKTDYSSVKLEAMEPITKRGFVMWQTVGKILSELDDTRFKGKGKYATEIANALQASDEYTVGRYRFKLIYNIGVANKIACEYVL